MDYQSVVGRAGAGPTVARMLVGAHLRRLREARAITRAAAGAAIRASHAKIGRIELGRTNLKPHDVADLLTLYGVNDHAERETLLYLASQANTSSWWQSYADLIPSWFEPYLELEQVACRIRCYEVEFIPGLLQTADYARAVIRRGHPDATDSEIERRVDLRMRRQRILFCPDPPRLWAVIDEAALRHPIDGAATMRAQLWHLLEMSEFPHVVVQILPFSDSGHAAAGGPFAILRLPEHALPDVIYLEQPTGATYPARRADLQRYLQVMNRLVIEAEPPAASIAMLRRTLRQADW